MKEYTFFEALSLSSPTLQICTVIKSRVHDGKQIFVKGIVEVQKWQEKDKQVHVLHLSLGLFQAHKALQLGEVYVEVDVIVVMSDMNIKN